eukprot:366097-Chlamydomonas_euryale.AAC.37
MTSQLGLLRAVGAPIGRALANQPTAFQHWANYTGWQPHWPTPPPFQPAAAIGRRGGEIPGRPWRTPWGFGVGKAIFIRLSTSKQICVI